jgi:hypothetical protein
MTILTLGVEDPLEDCFGKSVISFPFPLNGSGRLWFIGSASGKLVAIFALRENDLLIIYKPCHVKSLNSLVGMLCMGSYSRHRDRFSENVGESR